MKEDLSKLNLHACLLEQLCVVVAVHIDQNISFRALHIVGLYSIHRIIVAFIPLRTIVWEIGCISSKNAALTPSFGFALMTSCE